MHLSKWIIPAAVLFAALPVQAGENSAKNEEKAETVSNDEIGEDCTFKGTKLNGKVQIVDSFPDFKVQIVDSFPDLKVKLVTSFPDDCGEWQIVDSFPDFKIQYVDSFPDFKIKLVDSFPGVP